MRGLSFRLWAVMLSLLMVSCGNTAPQSIAETRGDTNGVDVEAAWLDCAGPQRVEDGDASFAHACVVERINAALEYTSVEDVVRAVSTYALQEHSFGIDCHAVEHEIAFAADNPTALAAFIKADSAECLWGFMHGALEKFGASEDSDTFWELLPGLCTGLLDEAKNSCVHGIGHAIAYHVRGNVKEAEPRCQLVEEAWLRDCLEAVFMSYSNGQAGLGNIDAPLDPVPVDELSNLCTTFTGVGAEECWALLWAFYPREIPLESYIDTMRRDCQGAGEYVAICANGLGQSLMLRDSTFGAMDAEFADGLNTCLALGDDMTAPCVAGLSESAALRWLQYTQDLEQIPDLCRDVPSSVAEACLSGLDKYVS